MKLPKLRKTEVSCKSNTPKSTFITNQLYQVFLRNTNESSGSDTMESTVCGRYWLFSLHCKDIS